MNVLMNGSLFPYHFHVAKSGLCSHNLSFCVHSFVVRFPHDTPCEVTEHIM